MPHCVQTPVRLGGTNVVALRSCHFLHHIPDHIQGGSIWGNDAINLPQPVFKRAVCTALASIRLIFLHCCQHIAKVLHTRTTAHSTLSVCTKPYAQMIASQHVAGKNALLKIDRSKY